ncbi:hypothetical protein MWH25_01170 [Natroniella acetigena]|uniref:hypothetical protein n=1 Tax=Natroniella acetigena TaxID=52004 RepID=UPI00200ABD67|nr:hypothetical protein [Natroniella acetigena]MCK8826357.1 hypothetical protein [Natroniella acetigena]
MTEKGKEKKGQIVYIEPEEAKDIKFTDHIDVSEAKDHVVLSFYQTIVPRNQEGVAERKLINKMAFSIPHIKRVTSMLNKIMQTREERENKGE